MFGGSTDTGAGHEIVFDYASAETAEVRNVTESIVEIDRRPPL